MTVRPKGWAELGAALIILARDAQLRQRMGAYGHEKARLYSWPAVAKQVVEVYEEARAVAASRAREIAPTGVSNVHHAV
jgi:glycosyltransferase involved in cell wall biosynthesis